MGGVWGYTHLSEYDLSLNIYNIQLVLVKLSGGGGGERAPM